MKKREKLGASAAFGEVSQATSQRRQLITRTMGGFPADLTRVPLQDLVGNPANPREELGDLQELAESLKQHGLRQPVGVMLTEDFVSVFPEHRGSVEGAVFVVVNGNRRLAAAKVAGLETLAVHVTELQDSSSVRIAVLVENIHRQDLAPLEEAAALRELVSVYGSNAEVARQLSKSRMWVGQRLALLDLLPPLKEALREGSLKLKDARRLGTLPPEEQETERERLVNPVYSTPSDSGDTEVLPDPPQPSPNSSDTPSSGPASGSSSPEPERRDVENLVPRSSDSPEGEEDQPVQLMLDLEWHGEAKTLARQIYESLQESLGVESRDAVLDALKAYR